MARGGINKALVMKAREALVAKGENPSIDAVRVELGNTGSKSTIHRYLKELEEAESARLDDEALLSQPIQELVARLAAALKQQAQSTIDENDAKYHQRIESLSSRIEELEESLSRNNQAYNDLDERYKETQDLLAATKQSEEGLKVRELELTKTEEALRMIISEKTTQIDSLEKKHQHNREAMEHYRQSVQEQRDQDHRKHEAQTQQLQSELRLLNQSLSVKQSDITQLNKDNGRLAAELGAMQKTNAAITAELRETTASISSKSDKIASLNNRLSTFEAQESELDALKSENQLLTQWKTEALLKLSKLDTELTIKTELVDRLVEAKREAPSKSDEANK